MAQSQWIILLVAAAVAVVVLARLFMVLGRKSGTELRPVPSTGDARALQPTPQPVPAPAKLEAPGLFELQMADRNFDAQKFLAGAASAYGQIVTAFERGDAAALKPLVSPDVLDGFSGAIAERGDTPSRFHFSEVRDAAIEHATVQNGLMEITVRFDAVFETAEKVGAPHEITDRWTFNRTAGSADPNWTLVATAGEAA